jgi:hypothetical protein
MRPRSRLSLLRPRRFRIFASTGSARNPSKAFASPASFRLNLPARPRSVAAVDNLAQSLEARIARSSLLEVGENLRQRDACCRPIVNAFLRQPARVANGSPHNFSNRGAHGASHFLSSVTPDKTGQMWRHNAARVSCQFGAGAVTSSRDVTHSRASILDSRRHRAFPAIAADSAFVRYAGARWL